MGAVSLALRGAVVLEPRVSVFEEGALRGYSESMAAHSDGMRSLMAGLAVGIAFIALAAVLIACFGDGGRLFDSSGLFGLHPGGRGNLVLALLIAFTYGAGHFEQRSIPNDLRQLQPLLQPSGTALASRAKGMSGLRRTVVRRAAVAGAAIGCAIQLLPDFEIRDGTEAVQLVFMTALFSLLMVRAFESLWTTRRLSELGRSHTNVRLFDSGPIHVFGRVGLRLSRNWFIGSTIASLLFIDTANPTTVAVVLVMTYSLAVLTLVFPALGIHENLRDLKRRELTRARRAIEEESAALFAAEAANPGGRLPALVAYEARVEAVHEWPFDAPMMLRFVLLALIATGSWVGGAVVERLLGLALG